MKGLPPLFRSVKVMKHKDKTEQPAQPRGAEGDGMTKPTVLSWMGSWNRKRTCVKYLVKSKWSLEFG